MKVLGQLVLFFVVCGITLFIAWLLSLVLLNVGDSISRQLELYVF
jgi:hypothetical protein